MDIACSHDDVAEGTGLPERRQIFVCGDLHNLGDLKLLLQNLSLTQGRGGIVRRWAPLPEAIERQVEAAGGTLVPGKAILQFARRAWGAQIVLGGGQMIRGNVSIAALAGLLLAVVSAKLGGGRLVTRGLGISRISSPVRRWLWWAVLMLGDTVNLRDEASARNLRMLSRRKAHVVNADMAFLSMRGSHAILPGDGAARWIIVAPCIDGSEGRSLEGEALDAAVRAAIDSTPEARLVIACHDPREEMDKAAAIRLAAHWHDRDVAVMDGYELSDLVGLYREAAVVLTNRLHSLIFAILADVPVVAIEDGTAKVQAVAERFSVPVLRRDDVHSAEGHVRAALDFDRPLRDHARRHAARTAAANL